VLLSAANVEPDRGADATAHLANAATDDSVALGTAHNGTDGISNRAAFDAVTH
jgi:hypothetical protein